MGLHVRYAAAPCIAPCPPIWRCNEFIPWMRRPVYAWAPGLTYGGRPLERPARVVGDGPCSTGFDHWPARIGSRDRPAESPPTDSTAPARAATARPWPFRAGWPQTRGEQVIAAYQRADSEVGRIIHILA